ncbi:MAG: hypothetical protein RIR16_36 [Actinomycetota bacterium]
MFAQVVIDSPILQLDRVFDYELSSELEDAPLGIRVRVPFGKPGQFQDGYLIGKSETSDFSGQHAKLNEVISLAPVLSAEIYQLCRLIADRQVVAIGDVLRRAIPNRSVQVEKKWLEQNKSLPTFENYQVAKIQDGERTTSLTSPISPGTTWLQQLLNHAKSQLESGSSIIAVLPDFRDLNLLEQALGQQDWVKQFRTHRIGDEAKPSANYRNFLELFSTEPTLVFGSRSAIYSPVYSLGEIFIVDESNPSQREQASPYISSRDAALLRQQVSGTRVHLASTTRSTDVQRFINLGYFKEEVVPVKIPKISVNESESRIDSHTWQLARKALSSGPVLIQVSTRGTSQVSFCSSCSARALCERCNGPLWVNENGHQQCRWCASLNLATKCHECGGNKFRQIGAGTTRTLAQFGQLFPGVKLVESTHDRPVSSVPQLSSIVVATPGAIPQAPNGYAAVIILDAPNLINRDWLRSLETGNDLIAESISNLNTDGSAIIVGLSGTYARFLSGWDQAGIASWQLSERAELRFPPVVRICSLEAEAPIMEQLLAGVKVAHPEIEALGPVSRKVRDQLQERVVLRFSYREGSALAKTLRAETVKLSAGSRQNSRGRSVRAIRIAMDDAEVL